MAKFKFVQTQWDGCYKAYADKQYLGFVTRYDGCWEAGDGTDHETRKAAAEHLFELVQPASLELAPLEQLRELGRDWLTISQIREVVTDQEFKTALFEDKVQIVDQSLGQPRMGEELLGSRQFKLMVLV